MTTHRIRETTTGVLGGGHNNEDNYGKMLMEAILIVTQGLVLASLSAVALSRPV
jgi:hypothetical protein